MPKKPKLRKGSRTAEGAKPAPSPADFKRLQELLTARQAAEQQYDRADRSRVRALSRLEEADQRFQAEAARLGVLPVLPGEAPGLGGGAVEGTPGGAIRAHAAEGAVVPSARPGPVAAGVPKAGPSAAGEEPPTTTLDFAEFMSGISEAMIAAQQRLDLQTEGYLSGSSSPRPLPTLFRLPHLKATAKYALEKQQGKKLNLLFYGSSSAATALQQHSVEFELVAVPPPPESGLLPGKYIPLMPRLDLVVDQAGRQAWLKAALEHALVAQALGVVQGTDPAQLPALLWWQWLRPAQPEAERPVQVFLAGHRGGSPVQTRLVLVQLEFGEGADAPRVRLVEPLNTGALAGWLGDFLREAGARQAQVFTGKTPFPG